MRQQRRRRPQRATLHRTQLPSPTGSLPLSFTNCTPQPAPCCVAEPKSLPAASLCSWRRANPGRGSTAARARSSAVAAPERTFLTACPPSCTAHPAAHTFLLPSAAAPTTTSHSQQCSSGRNIPAPVRSPQRRKRSQPPPTLRHSGHIPAPAPVPRLLCSSPCAPLQLLPLQPSCRTRPHSCNSPASRFPCPW
jgi:hypothetical protein